MTAKCEVCGRPCIKYAPLCKSCFDEFNPKLKRKRLSEDDYFQLSMQLDKVVNGNIVFVYNESRYIDPSA